MSQPPVQPKPRPTPVRPGQVWADNDWRARGQTIIVRSITAGYATCEVLTERDEVLAALLVPRRRRAVGTTTTSRLARFRPSSTGYRLVQEAPSLP